MTATLQLLDQYKKFHRLQSDYAAAKQLGIRQTTISKWHQGGSMDETTAVQIAQELSLDPLETIAKVRMDRPMNVRDRKVWERYVATFAIAALALFATVNPQTSKASPAFEKEPVTYLYIM